MRIRILFGCLLFATLAVATSAELYGQQETWVRLHRGAVEPNATTFTISLPEDTPRIRSIKLAAQNGPISLRRVEVTYGNGQVHFDERAMTLQPGERSPDIDERQEARAIQSIAITLQKDDAPRSTAEIEVWGLNPPDKTKARGGELKRRYVDVPIFYGTTRQREKDRTKNNRILATFSGEPGNDLIIGRAIVTVPLERDPGTISRPETNLLVARIALRNEDPNRDFTIAAIDVMEKDEFVYQMKKQVAYSTRYKGQAFVFVHGYNVSFDDAIFRTAQIAYDIGFDGPAITFSWPSRGGAWDYVHDINTAKSAREGLRTLLETIARDADVSAINLVAHSMGNDPVIEVLREQASIASSKGEHVDLKLNEVVFAAPDISRVVFEQFANRFVSLIKGGVTLYASKNDLAMTASKRISSGLVRAGDVPKEGIVIVPGIESIDVSEASTDFFSTNHSSFAERAHLVTDLRFLFERTNKKHPPDVRFVIFRPAGTQAKQWWQYRGK